MSSLESLRSLSEAKSEMYYTYVDVVALSRGPQTSSAAKGNVVRN